MEYSSCQGKFSAKLMSRLSILLRNIDYKHASQHGLDCTPVVVIAGCSFCLQELNRTPSINAKCHWATPIKISQHALLNSMKYSLVGNVRHNYHEFL